MPLVLVRNDITKMHVDAIVNAAKKSLRGGGGVDGCIHRAAGPELLEACLALDGCPTGSAKITKGYNLPCKYVIHAVGPHWLDGEHGERDALISCYKTALELAVDNGCESVAFPLISSGNYGYPKDLALKVAIYTISEFLYMHDLLVYIVIFDRKTYQIGAKLHNDIKAYIDDNYVEEHTSYSRRLADKVPLSGNLLHIEKDMDNAPEYAVCYNVECRAECRADEKMPSSSLDLAIRQLDESFTQMLLRLIDKKGMTDVQCYRKANIDRKLFSKIRGDVYYRPNKQTAIAFAIALELPLADTQDLLMKAGYALSHSNKFDIIIEYFINKKQYNVFEINDVLFFYDQKLLGK